MVDVLVGDLAWLHANPAPPKQAFCLKFITLCCQKMGSPVVIKDHFDFQWLYRYSKSITILGRLYSRTKDARKMQVTNDDMKHYLRWIQQLKQVLLQWKKKIQERSVNYDELIFYINNNDLTTEVTKACGFHAQSCLLYPQTLTELHETVCKQLEVLQEHLIKCIPKNPLLQW